ncbi:hypothetical protein EXIGLDRAFT_700899 [Exidia glandulosa HHB12029]|uniref:DNA breaking-rejoining enzyme n=1 Tax=Exidia glandulosa HHB12029 TaxID=1314781 RepID=A0A165D7Y8_EXIGL|nr:hypothetical protein EXIGLDRAFT_700899 [Exidia glandulosa HHB12029]
MSRVHGISDDTWARTLAVHNTAVSQGTLKNYDSAAAHFQQWCAAERIPFDNSRSIPEPILCVYAASMAGVYAGGTARSKLAGLRYAHELHALRWLGSPRLLQILNDVDLAAPDTARRDQRPPVTVAMLDKALLRLDPHRLFNVCVAAAMPTIFWGQLRGGEVLSMTRTYNFTVLPTVKGACLQADAGGNTSQQMTAIWLPCTKVERRGIWIWLARHYNDPSQALREHFEVNRLAPDDPLFAYRDDRTDAVIPLTRNTFLSRLNEIWSAAGMQRVTAHCFRIGGTTALLRAGVDPEVVKIAGRWCSDSFLRYW